jgi:hypothetical protein
MEHTQTQAPPQAVLIQMLGGQILSRCIGLAANLAIADHLAGGPQSIEALAAASATQPDALYRVLRMLAGFGIFAELPGRRFQNSPLAEPLRTDVPGSVRDLARWFSDSNRLLIKPIRLSLKGRKLFGCLNCSSACGIILEPKGPGRCGSDRSQAAAPELRRC